MTTLGRTWWGQRFIAALEGFTDHGRLQRGRSYSGDSRVLAFAIADGLVTATVRGNVNPYYGIYKEPRYQTRIQMTQIPAKDWDQAIAFLGSRADLIARLLLHEMPDGIDAAFAGLKLPLLPRSRKDFARTECSCPDDFNPCKHIAGVYFRLAAQLDRDPFLLFELRGLSRTHLHQALATTPLGQALASLRPAEEEDPAAPLEPAATFFTRPLVPTGAAPIPKIPGEEGTSNTPGENGLLTPPNPTGTRATRNAASIASQSLYYHAFWSGRHRLPTEIEPATPPVLPAILVRKAGDYPGFWDRDSSFITVMEELYQRVREKSRDLL
jgi:uncharacterized Zn finger protein